MSETDLQCGARVGRRAISGYSDGCVNPEGLAAGGFNSHPPLTTRTVE